MKREAFKILIVAVVALAILCGLAVGLIASLNLGWLNISHIDRGGEWHVSLGQECDHQRDRAPNPVGAVQAPVVVPDPAASASVGLDGTWSVVNTGGIQLRFTAMADGRYHVEQLLPNGFVLIGFAHRDGKQFVLDVRFHRLDRIEEAYPVRVTVTLSLDGRLLDGTWQALDGQNGGSYRLLRMG